jgi:hypothetical protein
MTYNGPHKAAIDAAASNVATFKALIDKLSSDQVPTPESKPAFAYLSTVVSKLANADDNVKINEWVI